MGAAATAAIFGATTAAANKGIDVALSLDRWNAAAGSFLIGAFPAAAFMKAFKPSRVVSSLVQRPGSRAKERAQKGLNMDSLEVIQGVEVEVAKMDGLTDEERIRETYVRITQQTKGKAVYEALCVRMANKSLECDEDKRIAANEAAEEAVACLYALFNLETFDEILAAKIDKVHDAGLVAIKGLKKFKRKWY